MAAAPIPKQYEELRQQADLAKERGDLDAALDWYTRAWEIARATGDRELTDRATCNRCFPAIELGEWEAPARDLREVLLRSAETEIQLMASYHLARGYELRKEYRKALFYARTARQHTQTVDQPLWSAASLNQLGNLLLAESQPEAALAAYHEALATMPAGNAVWRARVLDNLGYCRVLQGRLREGFSLLLDSLRTLRRLGARRFELSTRLDLCFAYLEAGRYRRAIAHGEAALALSEEFADDEALKNALYLLGDAVNLAGDAARARALFSRLQHDYFPRSGFIPDFLLAVDVRKMVNLRA